MTTEPLTLTDFLLARIAEDEAVASLIGGKHGGIVWTAFGGSDQPETSWWRARWDTARVLAECDAKRRIVEQAVLWQATLRETPEGWTESGCTAYRMAMEYALHHLATPYADHPDYDEAWKP